jgi:hypothetical protein
MSLKKRLTIRMNAGKVATGMRQHDISPPGKGPRYESKQFIYSATPEIIVFQSDLRLTAAAEKCFLNYPAELEPLGM